MSSILAKVESGPKPKPFFVLLYGVAGVGKTVFASQFPKPIFLCTEDGASQLAVDRLNIKNLGDFSAATDELLNGKHEYQTVVVDSLDQLEILVWDEVCRETGKAHISEIPYGGGYAQALDVWKTLANKWKMLREKMNVILIAHSHIKTINDPNLAAPHDKHVIKLHQKASDLLKEVVDAVLFASYEVRVVKADAGAKGRAVGEGKRLLFTMAMPAHEGKNRYGLPYELPLNADAFVKAVSDCDPMDINKVRSRCEHYIKLIKDQKVKDGATAALKRDHENLWALNKLESKLKIAAEI